MKWLTMILGALRAIKWLSPFGFALKWANPVWGIALTVFQVIWGAVKYVLKGVFSFLQNPAEATAVAVIIVIALAIGIHFGLGWDKHLVERAQAQLESVYKKMGNADDRDAARAAAATKARHEAEEAMRARITAEVAAEAERAKMDVKRDPPSPPLAAPVAPVAADPLAEPAGVRKHANKVRGRKQKPVVSGFSADWNKSFGAYIGKID